MRDEGLSSCSMEYGNYGPVRGYGDYGPIRKYGDYNSFLPYATLQVPLHVKGRSFPLLVDIQQYCRGGPFSIAYNKAYKIIDETTQYLRSVGFLLPCQTIGYPEVYESHVDYRVIDGEDMAARRTVMAELPTGVQRMLEKRAISGRCRSLPEELVHLIHDFVRPVNRRQKW